MVAGYLQTISNVFSIKEIKMVDNKYTTVWSLRWITAQPCWPAWRVEFGIGQEHIDVGQGKQQSMKGRWYKPTLMLHYTLPVKLKRRGCLLDNMSRTLPIWITDLILPPFFKY